MATHSQYKSFEIEWREAGEQFVAVVQKPADDGPPAIITASVGEGMETLKSRTHAVIDAEALGAYRPILTACEDASPFRSFMNFLSGKERELGEALCAISEIPQRISRGWVFSYQSRAYVETGDFSHMLVGQGPLVVTDDGEIIEGGSQDRDPEALLHR